MPSEIAIANTFYNWDRIAFIVKWVTSIIQIMGYTATGFGWTPWNLYLFIVTLWSHDRRNEQRLIALL